MNPLIKNTQQPTQQQPTQQMPNISEMFQKFKQNPMDYLLKSKLNIPDNIGNNPQNILQYLVNSGQVSQQKLSQAQAIYRQMGGR